MSRFTYAALKGSSGIVAVDTETGHVIGSCVQHVRTTHLNGIALPTFMPESN